MEGRSLVGGFGSESWQVLRRNAQSSISFDFGFSRLKYGMEAFPKSVTNLLIGPIKDTLPMTLNCPCRFDHLSQSGMCRPEILFDQHLFEDLWCLGLIYLLVGLTNMMGLHCFEVET